MNCRGDDEIDAKRSRPSIGKTRDMCHARLERVRLVGTRSADYIRASGHNGCIQRPYTWLHPTRSLIGQIFPLHRGRRPYMALRVVSPRRSSSVTFGAKRTSTGRQNRLGRSKMTRRRLLRSQFSNLRWAPRNRTDRAGTHVPQRSRACGRDFVMPRSGWGAPSCRPRLRKGPRRHN
jgi:hypothetical protein